MKECPFCGEKIQDEAIKCRSCGEYMQGEENAGSEIVDETSSEKSNKEHKSKIVKKRRSILALLVSFLTPRLV